MTCNFNGTYVAKNRKVVQFGIKMDKKCLQNRKPPSETERRINNSGKWISFWPPRNSIDYSHHFDSHIDYSRIVLIIGNLNGLGHVPEFAEQILNQKRGSC